MRDEDSGNTPTVNLLEAGGPKAPARVGTKVGAEDAEDAGAPPSETRAPRKSSPPLLPSVQLGPSASKPPLWNHQKLSREERTVQIQRPSPDELRKAAARLRAPAAKPRWVAGIAWMVLSAGVCAGLVTAAVKLRGRAAGEGPAAEVAPLASASLGGRATSTAAPPPQAQSATPASAAAAEPPPPPTLEIEIPATAAAASQSAPGAALPATGSTATAASSATTIGPKPSDPVAPAPSALPLASVDSLAAAAQARQQGNIARARTIYRAILAKNPDDIDALTGLGDLARAAGKNTDARAFYEHALIMSPTHGPAVLGLADTLWDLDQRDAARERYAELLKRGGPSAYPPRVETRAAQ